MFPPLRFVVPAFLEAEISREPNRPARTDLASKSRTGIELSLPYPALSSTGRYCSQQEYPPDRHDDVSSQW